MKHPSYPFTKAMKTIEKEIEKPVYEIDKNLKSHADDPVVKKKVEKGLRMLKQVHPPLEGFD